MNIDDATKRVGDRVVSMIASGELKIADPYVEMQVEYIDKMRKKIENELGGTKDE